MPSVDAWIGSTFPLSTYLDDVDRAYDIALHIADKTTSIVVIRGGAAQTAQNVRLEEDRGDGTLITAAGRQHQVDAIVFGYRNHATIADTDLQPGDRFRVDGLDYEVIALVNGLVSSLQAYCSVRS